MYSEILIQCVQKIKTCKDTDLQKLQRTGKLSRF